MTFYLWLPLLTITPSIKINCFKKNIKTQHLIRFPGTLMQSKRFLRYLIRCKWNIKDGVEVDETIPFLHGCSSLSTAAVCSFMTATGMYSWNDRFPAFSFSLPFFSSSFIFGRAKIFQSTQTVMYVELVFSVSSTETKQNKERQTNSTSRCFVTCL